MKNLEIEHAFHAMCHNLVFQKHTQSYQCHKIYVFNMLMKFVLFFLNKGCGFLKIYVSVTIVYVPMCLRVFFCISPFSYVAMVYVSMCQCVNI